MDPSATRNTPHSRWPKPSEPETLNSPPQAVRDELQAALDPAELARYAIRGGDADFEEALGGRAPKSGIVNVRLRPVHKLSACCSFCCL